MEKIRNIWSRIRSTSENIFYKVRQALAGHRKQAIALAVAVLAVIAGTLWFFLRTYHDYSVVDTYSRNSDTSAEYYFREDGFICYSKDGISFSDNSGEVLWNQVFDMSSPKLSVCGDYMAIGDVGANTVYIFNGSGTVGRLGLENPLQDLRVAGQGVVAAVLSDGASNQINLYNTDGEELVNIRATISQSGYPLALAVSDDATKMAVSYIKMTGTIGGRIVFYDFSDPDESGEKGSFEYDQLFPKLEFMDKKTLLACGEDDFMTFNVGGAIKEATQVSVEEEMRSIFVTDDRVGVIVRNSNVTEETPEKYILNVYTLGGRQKLSLPFDFEYKYVEADGSDIILYNDDACRVYNYRGHLKFEYTFEQTIESVLPAKGRNTYMLINSQEVQKIRLK